MTAGTEGGRRAVTSAERAAALHEARNTSLVNGLIDMIERSIVERWTPHHVLVMHPANLGVWKQAASADRRAALDTVKALYEAGGWQLTHQSDQRDGEWIELRVKGEAVISSTFVTA